MTGDRVMDPMMMGQGATLEKRGLVQSDGADNDGGDGNREGGRVNGVMQLKLMAGMSRRGRDGGDENVCWRPQRAWFGEEVT